MTRPKETAFHHYPHSLALCDCEPTHTWGGIDSISVRRAGQMDRCMECNAKWPASSQVDEQGEMALVVPCPKFAQRNTPCVPVDGVCAQCGNKAQGSPESPRSASESTPAKLPTNPRNAGNAIVAQSPAMGPSGPTRRTA